MATLYTIFTLLVSCMALYDHEFSYKHTRNLLARNSFRLVKPLRYGKHDFLPVSMRPSFGQWLRNKGQTRKRQKKIQTIAPTSPDMTITYFPVIDNIQSNAIKVSESKYKWIARVVHSPDAARPYLCDAACIEERIFITAARCIIPAAKIALTRLLYNDQRLKPVAFIAPDNKEYTKQLFDDIAFIVVDTGYKGKWETKKFKQFKRTDDKFKWFEQLGWMNGTAIGHVVDLDALDDHPLYELPVDIGIYLCNLFYGNGTGGIKSDYFVPCYHGCSIESQAMGRKCHKYLAGEGHVVIEEKTKDIIGIATWAGRYVVEDWYLPIGMSVLGSNQFRKDLDCSRLVRKAPTTGDYSGLCKK